MSVLGRVVLVTVKQAGNVMDERDMILRCT